MPLAKGERQDVEALLGSYCEGRVPEHVRAEVRLEFRIKGESVTLVERRPPLLRRKGEWIEIVVAQFRRNRETKHWTLYCADRNSRWHHYQGVRATKTLKPLLAEVDRDPTGIFWG
jgi:DUF3024 family protein